MKKNKIQNPEKLTIKDLFEIIINLKVSAIAFLFSIIVFFITVGFVIHSFSQKLQRYDTVRKGAYVMLSDVQANYINKKDLNKEHVLNEGKNNFSVKLSELKEFEKKLNRREKIVSASEKLKEYESMYFAKYSHIDLKNPNIDTTSPEYQSAFNLANQIYSLSKQAGKENYYKQFDIKFKYIGGTGSSGAL